MGKRPAGAGPLLLVISPNFYDVDQSVVTPMFSTCSSTQFVWPMHIFQQGFSSTMLISPSLGLSLRCFPLLMRCSNFYKAIVPYFLVFYDVDKSVVSTMLANGHSPLFARLCLFFLYSFLMFHFSVVLLYYSTKMTLNKYSRTIK